MGEFSGYDAAEWEALGTWMSAAVSLLLGVGALLTAFVQLRALRREAEAAEKASQQQLDAIERQIAVASQASTAELELLGQQLSDARKSSERQLAEMEEARKDAVLPLMIPMEVDRISTEGGSVTFKVHCRNIGTGPAIRVEVDAWVIEYLPKNRRTRPRVEVNAEIEALVSGPRAGQGLLEAVGVGDTDFSYLGMPEDLGTHLERPAGQDWTVLVALRYRDVYGRLGRYPADGAVPLVARSRPFALRSP